LAFCRAGTKVLEILSDGKVRKVEEEEDCYWALANEVGLVYGCMEVESFENGRTKHGSDLRVDLARLEALYRKIDKI